MDNSTEAARFAERAFPLLSPVLSKYAFAQSGPVSYEGVDPKGGGRLFMVLFQSKDAKLLVRTRDGAAEVLLGSLSAEPSWTNEGWLWPAQLKQSTYPGAPSGEELLALQARLSEAHVSWV